MDVREDRLRAGMLGYAPGDVVPLHAHLDSDEIFFVVEGAATFEVGGEAVEASAGDMLHVGAGERHAIRVGDRGLVLLAVVAPNLDDAWESEESPG